MLLHFITKAEKGSSVVSKELVKKINETFLEITVEKYVTRLKMNHRKILCVLVKLFLILCEKTYKSTHGVTFNWKN